MNTATWIRGRATSASVVMLYCLACSCLAFAGSSTGMAQGITAVGGSGAKQAVESSGGKDQYMFGTTLMFFNNESIQGDQQLPGGTTIYSQINLQYNLVSMLCGFGLIYQQDKIGDTQSNQGLVFKAEFTWNGYYMEAGYGSAQQTFVNRAVQSRSGTQTMYGMGIRVPFLQEFMYFDGGVRKRTSVYTKQDGVGMTHPLSETIFMPFIGFGISI